MTSAAAKGASIFKMMDVSRRKSLDTLRGYVRDAELFKDHAGPDNFDKEREPVTSQGHCPLECRIHYRERAWSASRLES